MNSELSQYVKDNYPDTKQDLFSVFMEVMLRQTIMLGRTAFITMESWMFLSSFERMRKHILDNYTISSLGHFGWHIIGIPFGTGILTTIILAIIVEKAGYASINIGRQTSPFEALKGPASAIALELLKYGKDNISTEDIIGVITHKLPK